MASLKQPSARFEANKTQSKSKNLEISINHETPPRYKPGSGPRLQRPKLLMRRDSTAYIIDRVFRPAGLAKDGRELPKQVMYFIGWRDLPAATYMVPAMDVLDYVSPPELEEWESKMQDHLDEQVQLAEKRRKESKTTQKPTDKGKKRGPRAASATEIEGTIDTLQQPDTTETYNEHNKRRGASVSLSTPQKRKMTDFDDISEELTPSKQILQEQHASVSPEVSVTLDLTTATTQDGDILTHQQPPNRPPPLSVRGSWIPSATESLAVQDVVMQGAPTVELPIHETPRRSGSVRGPVTALPPDSNSDPEPSTTLDALPGRPTQLLPTNRTPTTPPHIAMPAAQGSGKQVKKILDFQYVEGKDGKIKRMFHVLWDGNGPQRENRTWEPQANLPKQTVRSYFEQLKTGARRKPSHELPQANQLRQSTLSWGELPKLNNKVVEQTGEPKTMTIPDSTSNTKDELN